MMANELRKKSHEDLKKELIEIRREQFNMRMQRGLGQMPRPDQMRKARRNVARIKTVLNERAKADK